MRRVLPLVIVLAFFLPACAAPVQDTEPAPVQIVLEEGAGFTAPVYVSTVERGGTAVFQLLLEDGYTIVGTDDETAELVPGGAGDGYTLTIPNVRYSTVVSVKTERSGVTIAYHANGGRRLDGGDGQQPVELAVTPSHLRLNTAAGIDLFERAGYTLIGWNTMPDGSGESTGLGSRIAWTEGLILYAQWAKWTEERCFAWEQTGSSVRITGYNGDEETLVIPGTLGGAPVYSIGENACKGAACRTLVLPGGLQRVEENAFAGSAVQTIYLQDDIGSITDYAFSGCTELRTLHINAAEPPAYSGSYFASFADKFDRLLSLSDQRKLVLFSGSSTRFGYDSSLLDAALPDYEIVNMGVFAYTSATPQLMLILDCMGEGDILLHAPEFDAAQRQFCTRSDLEDDFWCMMEANYDMAARLDLRQCASVFAGLTAYLSAKAGMDARSYALSPAGFDEDGNPVTQPSYNEYGDYCLYRPNAEDDAPVYGLPVDYTVQSFPKEQFIDPLNEMYQRFLDKGVNVCFTYAPRNEYAVSENSTPERRAELDRWLRESLIVPVISDIEESLYPGRYLSGTDNHLSTEGVRIRTERILSDLERQLEKEGADE